MLTQTLKHLGPCLSTELTEHLVKHHGLTAAAARQRVSRGDPKIKRLAHLPFARKARFLYHQDDYASPEYWRNLYAAIFATNGPYARALGAVLARDAVPLEHFLAACGAPIAQKKQVSALTVLDRLVAANVLVKAVLPGLGVCVMAKSTYERHEGWMHELAAATRSRLIAEGILLDSLKEWLRRLAMVSYNSVRIRTGTDKPLPRVGTFAWDLTAPSYVSGLLTRNKGSAKPGLIVCDVVLVDKVRLQNVEPFIHKARSTEVLKNVGRTMFILVAHRFEADAFKALRTAGIMPATPETLFGKDIADAFSELVATLNKAAMGSVDPEKFDELFSKLGKLEGAVGNMRGAFFEMLVAEVVRKTAPGEVQLNKICKGEDGNAEVDVYLLKENISARMIECKGIAPGSLVDDAEVGLWLSTRIKRVRHHLRNLGWDSPKPCFELWTSGHLSQEARQRVEKTRAANINKFELRIIEGDALRQEVKAVNDSSLEVTFEHHFLPQAAA